MPPIGGRYFAILAAICFAAGLNVYATIATLGLLARAGAVVLPGSLHALQSWWIIGASGVLFVVEFFGDKVPAFDLIWNALHTFVRIPVAALIAYLATSQLSPGEQAVCALAGGAIALAAHGGKTAARIAVTASPEPLSNIGLSLGEDAMAIFLVWFGGCDRLGGTCVGELHDSTRVARDAFAFYGSRARDARMTLVLRCCYGSVAGRAAISAAMVSSSW
jgi:hypothetical protein